PRYLPIREFARVRRATLAAWSRTAKRFAAFDQKRTDAQNAVAKLVRNYWTLMPVRGMGCVKKEGLHHE
ncbi:MAG: hypothetical protein E6719_01360, partial [Dermabacter sp.]|nr:hypothetical protein [Dermabacter sp.]